jgi:ethanolamine utilization protein EutA
MNQVYLIGLDFGTTTSSAVIAGAVLTRNSVTGRTELSQVRERFRSGMVFTPFQGDCLDQERLAEYLESWLAAGQVKAEEIFGGGALLTGLAARAENAAALTDLVRRRLRDALVATADDPCLESWLAFMGNCAGLSRARAESWIINLDIGGGTTNLALGRGGEVLRTGCLFVGARHIQMRPGTYTITKLSPQARSLLEHLGIAKASGQSLSHMEVEAIVDFYVRLLHAAVTGNRAVFDEPVARLHEQVEFRLPQSLDKPIITFSGGVGELVYNALEGRPFPPQTYYGDLGIDLARRLIADRVGGDQTEIERQPWPILADAPYRGGHATVYGLLQHSTQISGSTLFLPHPEDLPLADLPILGTVREDSSEEDLDGLVDLARRHARGGCLRVELANPGLDGVRVIGRRLAQALRKLSFPSVHPLVILVEQNLGKVLGHYITEWGALPLHVVVVDEISVRHAHYVHLGGMRDQIVPVSIYGLDAQGEKP